MTCDYQLNFFNNGLGRLYCTVPISKGFAKILERQMKEIPEEVDMAKFEGKTTEGANLSIPKMGLNQTNINMKRNNEPELISPDLKDPEVIEILVKVAGTMRLDPTPIRQGLFSGVGHMELLIISTTEIEYEPLGEGEQVSTIWGLTNCEFHGCEWSQYGNERRPDKFRVELDGFRITFLKVLDYESIATELSVNGGIRVTAEAITITKYNDLAKLEAVIDKASMILTFGTANWIVSLYTDIYKNGKLSRTLLYAHKAYQYVGSHASITNSNTGACHIRDFLLTAYPKYDSLKSDFGIHFVIEYYISALSQKVMNEEFLIAFVALECLSSYAPSYAEKHGEKIHGRAREIALGKIKNLTSEADMSLSEDQIAKIVDTLGASSLGFKDKLRYLFEKISFKYEKKEVDRLVLARGRLVHTGRHEDSGLRYLNDELFSLLDRIILTMMGWKGRPYQSKKDSYTLRILD